jgi:putative FmdB family regulatory protein
MPLYEYRCQACGTSHEAIHPMDGPVPTVCPQCHGVLKRIYGRVGVRFSGWGFGATDSLVPGDRRRKDFRRLREKAEEIADG